MKADELIRDARATASLQDFGDMSFAEGLRVLVDSINTEAGLSPDNAARFRHELVRLLVNRLRMQRDITRHPEILDEDILPPVFITSLPRTGSTKLHRMLAATGRFNAMQYWQAYNFAPFPDAVPGARDPRIAAAEEYLAWVGRRAPAFLAGHPMYAEEVEEERILLDAGFNSLYQHAAHLNVPSYIGWVLTQDPCAMFEDLRRLLQYLQWQHFRGQPRRWLLKTPALLGTEAAFVKVFPGADFIVTHRHPLASMPSVCALFCGSLAVYNDAIDPRMAGAVMCANFTETVNRHLAWRDGYPAHKVIDLRFDAVVNDATGVLTRVHDFLGLPFGAQEQHGVDAWLALDAARREQTPRYTLAEFGLDDAQVNSAFAAYIERYAAWL